jgi:hypothetical protein
MADQNTDLERRVLAHERILQFLIGELGHDDPPLLDRLAQRFAPHGRRADAHELTDAEDYAEQFVREIRKLGKDRPEPAAAPARKPDNDAVTVPLAALAKGPPASAPVAVGVRKRSGVWEVRTTDGHHGDYRQRSDAIEAALTEVGTRIDAGNVVDFEIEGRPFAIARRAAALKG